MSKLCRTILGIGFAALLAGGAFARPTAVREAAGPQPRGLNLRVGFLTVYSATQEHLESDNTYRYPHTDYRIYTRDGRFCEWVSNALSASDEMPERVILPSGEYRVVAESETEGTVSVPVVIRTGHTTELHLERNKDWTPPMLARASDFVRLPNGQPIGFRAARR